MQCAGNRGEDYHGLDGKSMFNSPHWNVAAISNGLWSGARMRDVRDVLKFISKYFFLVNNFECLVFLF